MQDPLLRQATSGAIRTYLGSFESRTGAVTIKLLAALVPGQSGTTLCVCYDAIGHRATDPSCPTCYGRGVTGGYAAATTPALSLTYGQSRIVQDPQGYQETQSGAIVLTDQTVVLKRDDLIVVAPDPQGTVGNADRRYVVLDEIDPIHVEGYIFARRYFVAPVELGAVVYRVPTANSAVVPSGTFGTI